MHEMTESELLAVIGEAESDAVAFNGEFMKENETLLNYYLGEPFGDEVEGRSQVVSTDVADVVEADMPSLARIFLGSGNVVTLTFPGEDPDVLDMIVGAGSKVAVGSVGSGGEFALIVAIRR